MPDDASRLGPIDPWDPRFDADGSPPGRGGDRSLVESRGPGASPGDQKVRVLRVAIPVLAVAGLAVVAAVFFSGLDPGSSVAVVGPVEDVRRAVAERPRRWCFNGANPCAWLTLVDGEVVAFNTNGPLPEEYGRQGVGWCPTSGWFGANSTGSRWDQAGRIVEGPAPRSLDRFTTAVEADGDLVVSFASLNAGLAEWQVEEVSEPSGPACDEIPFDRAADLDLDGDGRGDAEARAAAAGR